MVALRTTFGTALRMALLVVALLAAGCQPIQPTPAAVPAAAENIAGDWDGALEIAGATLRMIVTFSAVDQGYNGVIDIPQQGAVDLPLHDVRVDLPTIHFELLDGPALAIFDGQLDATGALSGEFKQSGMTGVLTLARAAAVPANTSGPPPYVVQEVTFANGDVTLAGTLTLPDTPGPHPALVLISGSGPQNRDEELPTIPDYAPFQEIADALARRGLAVLRYDDRGVGQSSGDFASATTVEFAADVSAALAFLRARPEIDGARLGLCGHSEGSLIAAMVAADDPELAFVVSMAGPGVPGDQVIVRQVERIAAAEGASASQAAEAAAQERAVLDFVLAQDWDATRSYMLEIAKAQVEQMTEEQRTALGDVDSTIAQSIDLQVTGMQSAWFQYFLIHDPAQNWEKVRAPVLLLFGDNDVQVDVGQNRQPLEDALARAGNSDVTTVVFPTANHLFQDAKSGALSEYALLPATLLPEMLNTLADWVMERVVNREQ